MQATAPRSRRKALVGTPTPRIAPPVPAKADPRGFSAQATSLGLTLYPWQVTASRYLTAINAAGHPLFREVAIVVARQNGKTTLLMPLVVDRLLKGQRIMHAAQTLRLPGEFHRQLSVVIEEHYGNLLPSKRGISWRAGQESIRLTNGGFYQIVAATGGAPRGPSNHLVIIDEIRELADDRFLAGIKPTTIAQADAQLVYLSNAGSEESRVLNGLKARAGQDPRLAYLEWSAAPERASDDIAGWLEANPAIGHNEALLENLRDEHRAALLSNSMATFETEYLCRWVASMDERLVSDDEWREQAFDGLSPRGRPVMAVKMDISGERASAVVAWQDEDKRVSLDVVADVTGHPIDVDRLGPDLQKMATAHRASTIGFDPYTDADLVRYFRHPKAVATRDYATASEGFVRRVRARQFLVRDDRGVIAADLAWTVRRSGQYGSYLAVRANDDHTITAAEAAIRATYLAWLTAPTVTGIARIQ